MITVIATITLKEGSRQAFIDAINANVPNVLGEDGCIQYDPVIDVAAEPTVSQTLRANVVTVVEKWASLKALDTHLAAPHMASFRKQVADMVDEIALKVMTPAI